MKIVNSAQAVGLEVVPDGNDFLVLQSDSALNGRATRISGGNVGANFALASGAVVSAASNSRGTVVAGGPWLRNDRIAVHRARRDDRLGAHRSDVEGGAQTDERLIATSSGHQLTYIENHNLFTQFVDNGERAAGRTSSRSFVNSFATTPLNGGAAVAWIDGPRRSRSKSRVSTPAATKRGATIDVPVSRRCSRSRSPHPATRCSLPTRGRRSGSHHLEVHGGVDRHDGERDAGRGALRRSSDDGSN